MDKLNLFHLLKLFDKNELKGFEKFLQSPYFNTSEYLLNFFKEVKKSYPEFDENKTSKEKIFHNLYPAKKYNDATFRKLSSELFKLAEQYLSYKNFSKNQQQQNISLLNELNEKKSGKLLKNRLGKNPDAESEDFYHRYIKHNILYSHNVELNSYTDETNQNTLIKLLSKHYLRSLYVHYISLLHSRHYYDGNTDEMAYMKDAIKILKENFTDNEPELTLYKALYEMIFDYDNEKLFYELKKMIEENYNVIPQEALFRIYNEMQNYCWVKIYKGILKFEHEVYELYKDMLARNVFYSKHFPHVFFDNIVVSALNTGNDRWSEDFVSHYKDRLNPEIKDSVIAFNLSNIYYYRKDFGKAIEILSRLELIDFSYKIRIKANMIKIFYELKNFESSLSAIDSLKHFITKDKRTSKEYNLTFKNFADFTIELIKINEKNETEKLDYLKKRINDSESLFNKPWLLDKISELKK